MIASEVLLIRPQRFYSNPQTQSSNSFQQTGNEELSIRAKHEFEGVLQKLSGEGINHVVFDANNPDTPDACFPNNWLVTLPDKRILSFSMLAESRRAERNESIIDSLMKMRNYEEHIPLTSGEQRNPLEILEGTGSLILDHKMKTGYAALSPRTHPNAIKEFEEFTGYSIHVFRSSGPAGELIYHTNVMMALGERFVAIGLDTVDSQDQFKLREKLESEGHDIIDLTLDQVYSNFAGNMLQLRDQRDRPVMLLSSKAEHSLSNSQRHQLLRYNDRLISFDIDAIETMGGGSILCMLAELF
ncbi:MAG: hypothetical protein GWP27_04465 [Bacteroidetes bacterium]|nr:hypothetical protein [Bacteroidota bacterium]